MIPTLVQGVPAPAPVARVPALPIRFGPQGKIQRFATIATDASISTIASSLWKTAFRSDPGLPQGQDSVSLTLWLCDEMLKPWVELVNVPFKLIDDLRPTDDELTLGFEGCLAHLRVTLDYPRGKVAVSVSKKWLVSESESPARELPRRIQEGERLFRMGSYDAAVAMLAAGLEEYLQWFLPDEPRHSTLGELSRYFESEFGNNELRGLLSSVVNIRRKAVHGSDQEMVARSDADKVLRAVRTIVKQVSGDTAAHSVKRAATS